MCTSVKIHAQTDLPVNGKCIVVPGRFGRRVRSSFTTDPSETSVITITADCSRGNKALLLNYSNINDVYVHVGVITSASTGSSD